MPLQASGRAGHDPDITAAAGGGIDLRALPSRGLWSVAGRVVSESGPADRRSSEDPGGETDEIPAVADRRGSRRRRGAGPVGVRGVDRRDDPAWRAATDRGPATGRGVDDGAGPR